MTLYGIIFYVLSLVILATTALAITRQNLVHAVIYLIFSFFGSAMLFYLFGAPLLAVLEVIIYAGAIMVLFLFIIIMLKTGTGRDPLFPRRQLWPATGFGLIYLAAGYWMVDADDGGSTVLETARAEPGAFGFYIFKNHWLAIEIISLLLLVALVGALLIGRRSGKTAPGGHR